MSITDFLSSTGITCLYHFTDLRNLTLIKEYGLLPITELDRLGVQPPKPGGDDRSRDEDAKRGLNRFVHLCLKKEHPMEYTQRQKGHIGPTRFLRISLKVLEYPGVMGCSEVANKSNSKILSIEQTLDEIDLEILFRCPFPFSNEADKIRYKEARKSEILIPACIPQKLISNLFW